MCKPLKLFVCEIYIVHFSTFPNIETEYQCMILVDGTNSSALCFESIILIANAFLLKAWSFHHS